MVSLSACEKSKGTAVALGYFDGIHIGHRAVLEKALLKAKENDLIPVVMLFDIHPRKLISGTVPPMLMSEEQKKNALEQMGFRVVNFDFRSAMNYSTEEFTQKVLIDKLNVKFVSCGYDYHYGKGGKGNPKTLEAELSQLKVEVCSLDPVELDGEVVSSTKIRNLIEQGEIKKANLMLGKEFSYCFAVEKGDGLGRKLGFPTMNQFFTEDFIVPKYGVYASKVKIDGKFYAAVTNIGVKPTVGKRTLRSETCVLDFSKNLYGEKVEIFLLSYLREEQKFESLFELQRAVKKDIEKARIIYNEVMRNG